MANCELPDALRRYKYVDYRKPTSAVFDELLAACRPEAESAPRTPNFKSTKPPEQAEPLDYWINQPVDVYLVIRQKDERNGEETIRWMNVTHYLKEREDKTSRQIVFEGERLDMQAVWRLRDRFFPPRRGGGGKVTRKKSAPSWPGGLHAALNLKSTCTLSNGNTIRPSSVRERRPTFSSAWTSPCTDFTSRSTRLAASRIVTGPAPVRAFNNSHRLPVSTLKSRAGDSKLMRGEDALPVFKTCTKSVRVSASGRTSSVTVLIAPPRHIVKKIGHQPFDRRFCPYGAQFGNITRLSTSSSHRNRPLPELRLVKLSVDQHRRSAPGDLHRFRQHGRRVLRPLEQETAAAIAFGDLVVVGPREDDADVVFQDLDLLAGDLGPAGVVAHDCDHRQVVADEGVELGQAVGHGAVSINDPDVRVRTAELGP